MISLPFELKSPPPTNDFISFLIPFCSLIPTIHTLFTLSYCSFLTFRKHTMSINHYENFPVGSILLPRHLRQPIHAIYTFARTADDIADEGMLTDTERLAQLDALTAELNRIQHHQPPQTELMRRLYKQAIQPFQIPLQPFHDLLSAFKQDISKKRYQNFAELIHYCRLSANPIGRIILHLYGVHDERSLAQSDGICTALQLINFWQDIAIDWQKDRVYLPQDDLAKFKVSETHLANAQADRAFQQMMSYQCERAFKMLKAGTPLSQKLKGRIGLELRFIILGGQMILQKLDGCHYDVFNQRPILQKKDWLIITKRAIWQKQT